jgi:hypothetical protein
MKFPSHIIKQAEAILSDKSLNDFQKYEEMEEMLLDEGFDVDYMFDLLMAL